MASKAQIIATIGPASDKCEVLFSMIEHQVDAVRLNFSWGNEQEKTNQINTVRESEKKFGRKILIIQDLPGPRIQNTEGHTYNNTVESCITEKDVEHIFKEIEKEHGKNGYGMNTAKILLAAVQYAQRLKKERDRKAIAQWGLEFIERANWGVNLRVGVIKTSRYSPTIDLPTIITEEIAKLQQQGDKNATA